MKHNKNNNAGLILEILSKTALDFILTKEKDKSERIFKIIREHYDNENSVLCKANNIFGQILYNEFDNKDTARRFLNLVLNESLSINYKSLDIETKKIVDKVKIISGKKDIMENKTENYKLLASINNLMSDSACRVKLSPIEKVRCEDVILEHLTNNKLLSVIEDNIKLDNEKPDDDKIITEKLAMKLAVKKFNEKYVHLLNEEQFGCMKKYVSSSDKIFKRFIDKKIKSILKEIEDKKPNVKEDETVEKLEIVEEKFKQYLNKKELDKNELTEVLLGLDLQNNLKLF